MPQQIDTVDQRKDIRNVEEAQVSFIFISFSRLNIASHPKTYLLNESRRQFISVCPELTLTNSLGFFIVYRRGEHTILYQNFQGLFDGHGGRDLNDLSIKWKITSRCCRSHFFRVGALSSNFYLRKRDPMQ